MSLAFPNTGSEASDPRPTHAQPTTHCFVILVIAIRRWDEACTKHPVSETVTLLCVDVKNRSRVNRRKRARQTGSTKLMMNTTGAAGFEHCVVHLGSTSLLLWKSGYT